MPAQATAKYRGPRRFESEQHLCHRNVHHKGTVMRSALMLACVLYCLASFLADSRAACNLDAGLLDVKPGIIAATTLPRPIAQSSTEGPGQQSSLGEADLLKNLLEVLLIFPDRSLAVGAATKALNILQHGQEVRAIFLMGCSGRHLAYLS